MTPFNGTVTVRFGSMHQSSHQGQVETCEKARSPNGCSMVFGIASDGFWKQGRSDEWMGYSV